jgi:hypothetical protein
MEPTIIALQAELAALKKENAQLKKVVGVMAPGPLGTIQTIGNTLLDRQNSSNEWHGATLESINDLKPDYAGKVGELLIQQLCATGTVKCEYDEDKNSKDGTYDVKINGKKVEIKTARLGVQGAFQHETLKTDGYDYVLFVDITPNYFYLTVFPRFDMKQRHPVIGRTPHPRKGTSDVFKFDFGETNLKRSIEAGSSIKVDAETTMVTVVDFLVAKCI